MIITNQHYTLTVRPKSNKTEIVMKLTNGAVNNTLYFPKTVNVLKTLMPSVLKTTCFNDNQYIFTEEVKQTELGHLFEHILIDVMCQEKAKITNDRISYSGETSWDWKKFTPGSFYITISATKKEKSLLETCLQSSVYIMNSVLES